MDDLVVAGLLLLGVFITKPPRVTPAPPKEKTGVRASDFLAEHPEYRSDRKDWLGSLIAASFLVIGFLIITIFQFIIPLSIIGIIWTLNPSASGWMVLATVGLSLAAIVVTEFGFELPLCRLWGLPYGEAGAPRREDFCLALQDHDRQL